MARATRRVLRRADGLIADAHRDIRLGSEWGFGTDKPALVVPGSGGIDLDEVQPPAPRSGAGARKLPCGRAAGDQPARVSPWQRAQRSLLPGHSDDLANTSRSGTSSARGWPGKPRRCAGSRLNLGSQVRLMPYLQPAPVVGLVLPRRRDRFSQLARRHAQFAARSHGLRLLPGGRRY